jgi:hypothetical protein
MLSFLGNSLLYLAEVSGGRILYDVGSITLNMVGAGSSTILAKNRPSQKPAPAYV